MYGSKDDLGCDFPVCGGEFDARQGCDVAILKDGCILAFCAGHSAQLIAAGVPLQPLSSIHQKLDEPKRRETLLAKREREKAFSESLLS
jgi:hypothetical protein